MNSELKVAITRNLLEGHTCDICTRQDCKIKLGTEYNTCRRWTNKIPEMSLKMSSWAFTAKPRKLNITWSKSTELELESMSKSISVNLLEDNDFAVYKHLSDWVDRGALQTLAEKSCTKCIRADKCKKSEMNDYGFCDEYYEFDGSTESMLMKMAGEEMTRAIDEEILGKINGIHKS